MGRRFFRLGLCFLAISCAAAAGCLLTIDDRLDAPASPVVDGGSDEQGEADGPTPPIDATADAGSDADAQDAGDGDAAFVRTEGGASCADAIVLTLTQATVVDIATVEGSVNAMTSSCGGSGPERIYRFTMPFIGTLTVKVTPLTGSALAPVIVLRPACAPDAGELKCAASSRSAPATLTYPGLPSSEYTLVVDSLFANQGPYRLELSAAP